MNGRGGYRPGSGRKSGRFSLKRVIGEYLDSTSGISLSDLEEYLKNAELTGRMVKRKPLVKRQKKNQE